MSRFKELSHTIGVANTDIVGLPKYRHEILAGQVAIDVDACIRVFAERHGRAAELKVHQGRNVFYKTHDKFT